MSTSATIFAARFGNPYAVVHRGDLHGVFLKACRDSALIDLRVSSEVVGYDQDGSSVTVHLAGGEGVTGSLADRRRRTVVECAEASHRGRAAARLRPHHLSLGDPDRADAGGFALERGDAVGRPEMPHRALSAVGLEGVQPRRHLSQRRAGAGRRPTGVRRRGDAGVFPRACAGARDHPSWQELAALGAVRPRSDRALDRRPRRAARRRRASDVAVFRARRLPGDGGRSLPVAHAGAT